MTTNKTNFKTILLKDLLANFQIIFKNVEEMFLSWDSFNLYWLVKKYDCQGMGPFLHYTAIVKNCKKEYKDDFQIIL